MKIKGGAQPYRKGSQLRLPGPVLDAMTKGRTASGWNPSDVTRATRALVTAGKRRSRPTRPARPPR